MKWHKTINFCTNWNASKKLERKKRKGPNQKGHPVLNENRWIGKSDWSMCEYSE